MEQNPPSPVIPIRNTLSSEPPIDPPRPITPAVKKLIWLEPRVRRWWLLSILILLMFFAYAGDRLWARVIEKRLINQGTTLRAKIIAAENKSTGHPVGPGDLVQVQFSFPGQDEETQSAPISGKGQVGGDIIVHVDPNDHSRWTDRSEPTSLLDSLLIGMLVLPIIPVVLGIAFFEARVLVSTWRTGANSPAIIFDRKQSPLAPKSYAIRCSLTNSRNKQLFTIYVPRVGYGLDKGDMIWVISPQKKGRPVAAMWMAGGSA